jgi:HK97 family phage prohead protease
MSEEYKKIDVEFSKSEGEEGKVKAVFSVFNDVDSDGDVVLPTAIKSGFDPVNEEVPMVWAHQWDKPIGRGKIVKDGEKAVFDGEFFMDTDSGSEAYKLVKNMGNLQQWSFGFRVEDSEYGKFKKSSDQDEQDVRYLKNLSVYEVSPVLVGANQDTFTMAIKSTNKDTDEKGVLGHDSFQSEDQDEEVEEKNKLAGDLYNTQEEAEERAKQLGCSGSHSIDSNGSVYFMPCATHEQYEESMKKEAKTHTEQHAAMEALGNIANDMKDILQAIPKDENADLPQWWVDLVREVAEKMKQVKDNLIEPDPEKIQNLEVSEKSASVQGKRFSDEVKDVLAALNSLVARVQAIGELRQKNGRKLGVSATEALRTVQESVADAFDELDKFVEEFGSEGALETETVENTEIEDQIAETEVEISDEVETEEEVVEEEPKAEAEVVDPAEEPEVDTGDERETEEPVDQVEVEVDTELDNLWLESQEVLSDITLTDIELEDTE